MKKYKITVLAMLLCASLKGWAQEGSNVLGKVVDKLGNPVEGVLVSIENNPLVQPTGTGNLRLQLTRIIF